MSDPLDRLSEFGSSFEGGTMPKSASEVRARGDQIRRRRHGLLAAGAAAAVIAVTVPVFALTNGSGGVEDPPPATTSPSETVSTGALSEDNLLTDADTVFDEFGSWHTAETYPGDGQDAFHPCAATSLGDQGAAGIINRTWSFESTTSDDPTYLATHTLRQSVAEFADEEAANNAATGVFDSLAECAPAAEVYPDYRYLEEAPLESMPARSDFFGLYVSNLEYLADPGGGGANHVMLTGVVQIGNRITALTMTMGAQDYFPQPMQDMLPTAADLLTVGLMAPEGENAEMGVIPDEFPLEAGWPEPSEFESLDGPSRSLPSLEFFACDQPIPDLDHIDRLRADWTGEAEDFRSRQLTVYADGDVAGAAVDGLVGAYQDCPTDPVDEAGYLTDNEVLPLDVADGGWAILQRDYVEGSDPTAGAFGSTTIVIRDATSVLILDHGGHAGFPSGDGQAQVQEMIDEAAEVIAALPEIQENMDDGATDPDATDGPDLNAPAGTTEVPEDFPLDVHLDEGVEQATQVNGPDPSENGVFRTDICREDAAVLSRLTGNRLGYGEVYEGEGYHGRAIRAYPTVQAAVDEFERLEAQLAGCEQDVPFESTATRLWHPYESATGWNDLTFGFTYQGQAAGGLFTVVRVGNAILSLQTSGEYSARSLESAIPGHAAVVEALAPEMCVFSADGC